MSPNVQEPDTGGRSDGGAPTGAAHLYGRSLGLCPYLRSHDASWSSMYASRELRCWAVEPAAQPSIAKQHQVCLAETHLSCATYLAAEAADEGLAREQSGDSALWPAAAGVPVAIGTVRTRSTLAVGSPRAGGQALLVGAMVVALLVLVISRSNPLGGATATWSPAVSARPVASAVAAASNPVSPSPSASVAESASLPPPSPSSAPTTTPRPSATQRTYKVRSGDTVAAIAAKFHTTVTAIVKANNIVNPRTIHPGQVLVIP